MVRVSTLTSGPFIYSSTTTSPTFEYGLQYSYAFLTNSLLVISITSKIPLLPEQSAGLTIKGMSNFSTASLYSSSFDTIKNLGIGILAS